MQKVVAEISLRTIEENARFWKERTKNLLYAVVKDDAYGHGAAETACALDRVADAFAVANIDEAVALLSVTDKDILVLTPPATEEEAIEIVSRGCILTADGAFSACAAVRAAEYAPDKTARVHLKANTGMNRYGSSYGAFRRTCEILKTAKNVRVEGIFSHLAGITNRENAAAQRDRFTEHCAIAEEYFPRLIRHLSATAGACLDESFYFDAVRIGLGLYGYLPDGCLPLVALKRGKEGKVFSPVKIAMKAYARVVKSGVYRFGTLGYGDTAGVSGEKFHVTGAGYGGGFFRRKKNGMAGGVNIGAPCMDATLRSGGAVRGKREAVLLNAAATAAEAGTIPYEVLCAVGKNAERIYV